MLRITGMSPGRWLPLARALVAELRPPFGDVIEILPEAIDGLADTHSVVFIDHPHIAWHGENRGAMPGAITCEAGSNRRCAAA